MRAHRSVCESLLSTGVGFWPKLNLNASMAAGRRGAHQQNLEMRASLPHFAWAQNPASCESTCIPSPTPPQQERNKVTIFSQSESKVLPSPRRRTHVRPRSRFRPASARCLVAFQTQVDTVDTKHFGWMFKRSETFCNSIAISCIWTNTVCMSRLLAPPFI